MTTTSPPQACMYDTCACKDSEECMCAALSSYVHACAAEGVLLKGWRDVACSKKPRPSDQTSLVSHNVRMLMSFFAFSKRNTKTARPILSTVTKWPAVHAHVSPSVRRTRHVQLTSHPLTAADALMGLTSVRKVSVCVPRSVLVTPKKLSCSRGDSSNSMEKPGEDSFVLFIITYWEVRWASGRLSGYLICNRVYSIINLRFEL